MGVAETQAPDNPAVQLFHATAQTIFDQLFENAPRLLVMNSQDFKRLADMLLFDVTDAFKLDDIAKEEQAYDKVVNLLVTIDKRSPKEFEDIGYDIVTEVLAVYFPDIFGSEEA